MLINISVSRLLLLIHVSSERIQLITFNQGNSFCGHVVLSCRSHDGFNASDSGVLEATSDRYASQRRVFDDLGQGVLDNAFKGSVQ